MPIAITCTTPMYAICEGISACFTRSDCGVAAGVDIRSVTVSSVCNQTFDRERKSPCFVFFKIAEEWFVEKTSRQIQQQQQEQQQQQKQKQQQQQHM